MIQWQSPDAPVRGELLARRSVRREPVAVAVTLSYSVTQMLRGASLGFFFMAWIVGVASTEEAERVTFWAQAIAAGLCGVTCVAIWLLANWSVRDRRERGGQG